MKLRNKKTGEIYELNEFCLYDDKGFTKRPFLKSLAELNAEWEDYEEPKDIWWLDNEGHVNHASGDVNDSFRKNRKIGNYFLSREEAELAVRKLKAWKRLKDKGFRFESSYAMHDHIKYNVDNITGELKVDRALTEDREIRADLDLLFGGRE